MEDIEDEVLWRAFCLLRAVLFALKALRFYDSNHPTMDNIYFLVHCADSALKKSSSLLDDVSLVHQVVMMCLMKFWGSKWK